MDMIPIGSKGVDDEPEPLSDLFDDVTQCLLTIWGFEKVLSIFDDPDEVILDGIPSVGCGEIVHTSAVYPSGITSTTSLGGISPPLTTPLLRSPRQAAGLL